MSRFVALDPIGALFNAPHAAAAAANRLLVHAATTAVGLLDNQNVGHIVLVQLARGPNARDARAQDEHVIGLGARAGGEGGQRESTL